MQDSEVNKCSYMATVQKMFRLFGGGEDEDVGVWIRDARLVAEVYELSERELVKLMIVSLKDNALSWASQVLLGCTASIGLNEFIELLKKRFGCQNRSETTLSRFLTSSPPSTREEFYELLKDGTHIFEKQLMSNVA
ncbi:MAG: hypothetical protein ACRC1D_00070, partial [Culicoidibacterales bacterium]